MTEPADYRTNARPLAVLPRVPLLVRWASPRRVLWARVALIFAAVFALPFVLPWWAAIVLAGPWTFAVEVAIERIEAARRRALQKGAL